MPKGEPKANKAVAPKPIIEVPEGIVELYANSMSVILTPWDLALLFGSTNLTASLAGGAQMQTGQPAQTVVRVEAAIIMSPQHAKAAARALQSVVDQYEKQFGELHIPEVTT